MGFTTSRREDRQRGEEPTNNLSERAADEQDDEFLEFVHLDCAMNLSITTLWCFPAVSAAES